MNWGEVVGMEYSLICRYLLTIAIFSLVTGCYILLYHCLFQKIPKQKCTIYIFLVFWTSALYTNYIFWNITLKNFFSDRMEHLGSPAPKTNKKTNELDLSDNINAIFLTRLLRYKCLYLLGKGLAPPHSRFRPVVVVAIWYGLWLKDWTNAWACREID